MDVRSGIRPTQGRTLGALAEMTSLVGAMDIGGAEPFGNVIAVRKNTYGDSRTHA